MALSLTNAYSSTIATIGGEKIDLGFTAAEIIPQLAIPSFLNVAKNTSSVQSDDWTARRYYTMAKTTAELTRKDGIMLLNPKQLQEQQLRVEVAQFAPCQVAAKLSVDEIDLMSPKLKNALASAIGSWSLERRIEREVSMLNLFISAAKTVQKKILVTDETAISFKTGAHYINQSFNDDDSKKALKELWNAKETFAKIGLKNSPTKYDRGNLFTSGILADDILVLVSFDFFYLLTKEISQSGSDSAYNEVFKKMGLRKILGLDILPLQTMPSGVNFILIRTGRQGCFVDDDLLGGVQAKVVPDPNWTSDVRAELNVKYVSGILYNTYIFASVDELNFLEENLPTDNVSKVINRSNESVEDKNIDQEAFIKAHTADLQKTKEKELKKQINSK